MSIRESIVAAAFDALNGEGKPAAVTVHRYRARPIDAETELPSIVIYLHKEIVDPSTLGGVAKRRLRLRLEHRVEGEPIDAALDPLVTWGTQAMFTDPTLGGLVLRLEEVEIQWAADAEMDQELGAARQEFELTYHTDEADPTLQG
jgi:hypothetical protein